jgi:hypothetical protein
MLVAKGKAKTVNRGKRSRPTTTHRKDTKKAYVRVAEGKIEIAAFEEVTNQVRAAEAEKAKDEQKVSASTETKAAKMFAKRRTGRRGDR